MLKQLAIQQLRGFYAKQTFKFAIPNGKNGSGLTNVVGPNNSGKTTFIEALAFHGDEISQKRFNDSERHGNPPPVIALTILNGETEKITNINQGSQARLDGAQV